MIIGFVSFGKYLEQRAKKQSLNSLGLLLKLTPAQVSVQRDGHWQSLALDQVQIGDTLRANHGERIAADGIVTAGSGWAVEPPHRRIAAAEASAKAAKCSPAPIVTDGGTCNLRAEQLGSRTLPLPATSWPRSPKRQAAKRRLRALPNKSPACAGGGGSCAGHVCHHLALLPAAGVAA